MTVVKVFEIREGETGVGATVQVIEDGLKTTMEVKLNKKEAPPKPVGEELNRERKMGREYVDSLEKTDKDKFLAFRALNHAEKVFRERHESEFMEEGDLGYSEHRAAKESMNQELFADSLGFAINDMKKSPNAVKIFTQVVDKLNILDGVRLNGGTRL